jgi:hypothetical protein
MYELSAATVVLALLAGAEIKKGEAAYEGRAIVSTSDSLQYFLSDGQDGDVANAFLNDKFLPQSGLKLRAHSNCAQTVELRRIYLKDEHGIIFQEELAVPTTSREKAAVRASPALRTGTKPTELEAPVPEAYLNPREQHSLPLSQHHFSTAH